MTPSDVIECLEGSLTYGSQKFRAGAFSYRCNHGSQFGKTKMDRNLFRLESIVQGLLVEPGCKSELKGVGGES